MKRLFFMAIAVLAVASTAAWATPVYNGPTAATYGEGNNPALPTATGYYIWSNDYDLHSWSIRWTGNNGGTPSSYSWWGSVEIAPFNLDSAYSVQFEASDQLNISNDIPGFGDLFSWTATAGPVWDGIDFHISGDLGNVVGFNLGSSAFDLSAYDVGDVVAANGIFVGGDHTSPEVLIQQDAATGRRHQSFEVRVPEPGTLLLLGTGLLGLVGVGRKRTLS